VACAAVAADVAATQRTAREATPAQSAGCALKPKAMCRLRGEDAAHACVDARGAEYAEPHALLV
jgi:hypothetical protein